MTDLQRIIKYLAVALAIFLAVSIIGGILAALGLVTAFSGDGGVMEEMQHYTVSGEVIRLDMELEAAQLEIVVGEQLSVSSNLKKLTVKESGGTLTIRERTNGLLGRRRSGKLILSIPAGFVFREADIATGAGRVSVEVLSVQELSLELGAGEVNLQNLTVKTKANVEGGAGKITMQNARIHNLDMEMGVGEVDMTAVLAGSTQIECGIGNVQITLLGSKADYRIQLDTGLGNAVIDGQRMQKDAVYGQGDNRIALDAGIGNIRIDFAAPEAA